MKLISFFNHKGGVGKTTTTFSLGWALADQGKKVLLVDGDPQCNLTGTVLGFDGDNDFEKFYLSHPRADINTCMSPVFNSRPHELNPGELVETKREGLYLFMGHIDLADNESQLAVAISTGAALPALKNLPGSLCALIRMTAKKNIILIMF